MGAGKGPESLRSSHTGTCPKEVSSLKGTHMSSDCREITVAHADIFLLRSEAHSRSLKKLSRPWSLSLAQESVLWPRRLNFPPGFKQKQLNNNNNKKL